MMGRKAAVAISCLAILFTATVISAPAWGQTRINDRDMESLMRNLRDDAKSFQPVFNDSVKHSAVRRTSQGKDARALAKRFVKQTDAMLNTFKKKKKADDMFPPVIASAVQINKLVYSLNLNPQTVSRWEKVRGELERVAGAYGVPDPLAQTAQAPAAASAATPGGPPR